MANMVKTVLWRDMLLRMPSRDTLLWIPVMRGHGWGSTLEGHTTPDASLEEAQVGMQCKTTEEMVG